MKTLFVTTLLFSAFWVCGQTIEKHTVYFDVDSYKISKTEQAKLKQFLAGLDQALVKNISVEGHTDHDASDQYNVDLSKNRNASVLKQLYEAADRKILITASHFGESQPAKSNSTDSGKQQNRRVEITVALDSYFAPESSDFYFNEWDKAAKTFQIDPKQSTTIRGPEGTIVYFKPNTFCDADPNNKVNISLKEYYKLSDILMAQLTTTSGKDMLETAGMVELTAEQNGKELELCKTAVIMFPSQDTKDFRGFNGTHDTTHNIMDWTASSDGTYDPIDGGLFDSQGGLSGIVFPRDCINLEGSVKIRCVSGCQREVLSSGGKRYYNAELKQDEVVAYLRKKHWFKRRVSVQYYNRTYNRIKNQMRDTTSAMVYRACYNKQDQIERVKENLENLEDGGEINTALFDQTMNYVITSTAKLGFINCDRFTNRPNRQNFNYKIGEHDGTVSSKLIFHKIKSIMPGHEYNGKISFSSVPAGEAVTLLVIKYVKDKILIAAPQFRLGQYPTLDFEEVKRENLQDKIKSITSKI